MKSSRDNSQRLAVPLIWLAMMVVLAVAMYHTVGLTQSSGYNAFQTGSYSAVSTGVAISEQGLIKYHQLIWTTSGTVSTCQVSLDTSPDGSAWTVGGAIAAQTCTSNGSSGITGIVSANFLRVNVSTLSGGGSVTVNYEGWASQQTPSISDAGAGQILIGGPGIGTGSIGVQGTTSGSVILTCTPGTTCSTWTTASPFQNTSNGGISSKHLGQIAANNYAGTCTQSSGTCSFTMNSSYTTPICFAGKVSGTVTGILYATASGTTVTITDSVGTDTGVTDAICIGNPN